MAFLFFSCDQTVKNQNRKELDQIVIKNRDTTLTEKENYYLQNTKVYFGEPLTFDNTNKIFMPILVGEKYVDKELPYHQYLNIAVIGEKGINEKLLFSESVLIDKITHFATNKTITEDVNYEYSSKSKLDNYQKIKGTEWENYLFLEVYHYIKRKKGYKKLYVYDMINEQLHLISPMNSYVQKWNLLPKQNKISISFKIDSNSDGKFDEKDDENITLIHPKDSLSLEIFDVNHLKKMKLNLAKSNGSIQ
jgi:hypothetical protein